MEDAGIGLELCVERGENPWSGLTSSAQEESSSMLVAAAWSFPSGYAPLTALAEYDRPDDPLLMRSDKARRVLISARWFSDIERADGTSPPQSAQKIGTWKDLGFQRLSETQLIFFLLRAQIIRCYAHMEARLKLDEIARQGELCDYRFSGSHIYYTNSRHESHLGFSILLDRATGELSLARREG